MASAERFCYEAVANILLALLQSVFLKMHVNPLFISIISISAPKAGFSWAINERKKAGEQESASDAVHKGECRNLNLICILLV